MKTVTMGRAALLKIVIANLAKHVEAHARAEEGWEAKQLAALEAALAHFQMKRDLKGGAFNNRLILPKPQSHADEYRRVISMLKHSVDENIELSPEEFDSYVRNKWSWADSFNTMTAAYGKAGKKRRN